ncbi:uncharacterized protein [Euwallacea fornicatus]|uniref:uncharacterized protein n=1 Tax=Euwallacea fornicatus TaxID=995702 RepID=UPI00338E5CF5
MKTVVALLVALAAYTSASGVVLPQAYSYGGLGLAKPLAYSAVPLTYFAPVAIATPAIKSGYVAANPGAVHTAPLPEGPLAFSHHLNLSPPAGTL